mmetsp:Transcript_26161/g.32088  ORF Transcript_26161/g.32088 Transcript_26161/m.32088 type:complete len:126 (-) Transcript_26161:78-455(-)
MQPKVMTNRQDILQEKHRRFLVKRRKIKVTPKVQKEIPVFLDQYLIARENVKALTDLTVLQDPKKIVFQIAKIFAAPHMSSARLRSLPAKANYNFVDTIYTHLSIHTAHLHLLHHIDTHHQPSTV